MLTVTKDDSSPVEVWRDPIVAEVRQVREALFAEATMTFTNSAGVFPTGKQAGR